MQPILIIELALTERAIFKTEPIQINLAEVIDIDFYSSASKKAMAQLADRSVLKHR